VAGEGNELMTGENSAHSAGDLVWILEGLYNDDGDYTHFVGPGLMLERHSIDTHPDMGPRGPSHPEYSGLYYWTVAANEGIWNCFEDGMDYFIPKAAV